MKIMTILLSGLVFSSCAFSQEINTLSKTEKEQGWTLLFNGKNLNGWHVYGHKAIGPRWKVSDGVLELQTGLADGGDLVTDQEVKRDFELKLDWKIGPSSNSGLFMFFTEDPDKYEFMHSSGLELQIQDNNVYRNESKNIKKLAGDLFGIRKAINARTEPTGQWNQYHVIFQYPRMQIFLNGAKIHDIDMKSREWKEAVAASAHQHSPFANGITRGSIGLQDWHSRVWYRNIKLRRL